ncbi:MAG: replisome organizer [Clostridia bacterium]|nr:replisome organizer [Clostridia bacterium]
MAERRMFSKTIIDSDIFLDMPTSTRLLYYDLAMRADDDGFINNPRKIARMTGASDDDLKILASKNYIIPFASGIVVIRHWRVHNYIRKDTYNETQYKLEKSTLELDTNKCYSVISDDRRRAVDEPSTQVRLGKDRLDKDSINNIPASEDESSSASAKASKHKYGNYKNVLLKDEELQSLKEKYSNWEELIKFLDEYIEMKGYKAKSHYLCILKWVIKAVDEQNKKNNNQNKNTYNSYEQRQDVDFNKFYANRR